MKKIVTSLLIFLTLFSLLATFCFASETDNASEEAGNVFSEIYDMIILHSDKILSALAFLASLVLAFSYRKGMLPLIKGGLNTLSGAVSKLKEETEQVSLISKETTDSALNRISDVSDLLFTLTEKLSALESELNFARQEQAKYSEIKIIMQSQIDMLYEIFMSSSIPLYQKETVGEKINSMRKTLSGLEVKSDA